MPYKDKEKQRISRHKTNLRSYAKNKHKFKEKQRRRREEVMALAASIKDVPCKDCGQRYPPYVMDFDHLPGTVKHACVATLSSRRKERQMLEEIDKCEVVCANCHRIRTFARNDYERSCVSKALEDAQLGLF